MRSNLIIYVIFTLIISLIISSQAENILTDDFEDGNISSNPQWTEVDFPQAVEMVNTGHNSEWSVELYEWQSQGYGTMSTPINVTDEFEIIFWVKYRPNQGGTSVWRASVTDGEWEANEGFIISRTIRPGRFDAIWERQLLRRNTNVAYGNAGWYRMRMYRNPDGLWSIYWKHETDASEILVFEVEDNFENLDDPHFAIQGSGHYNEGGLLFDDISISTPDNWQVTLEERFTDGELDNNPTWYEYNNHRGYFAVNENLGHDSSPCGECWSDYYKQSYTSLSTPMNCGEEFKVDLWIHQRTPTFSIFSVGIRQGEYSAPWRGVQVRINYHDLDGHWYLCYWDHEGGVSSHNEHRIEYDPDRWANLVMKRDPEGNWIVTWDKNGEYEYTLEFQDSIQELDNPYIWWDGGGYYHNTGGAYIDDIVVTAPVADEPEIVLPNPIDFGEVEFRRTAVQTVQVGNVGTADLEIESVTVSGNGFEIIDFPAIVEPESTGDIVISFTPGEVGEFFEMMTIQSNDAESPADVTVNGTGVRVSPQELHERLIQECISLRSEGAINRGQCNGLVVKLEHSITRLNRGQCRPAVNQINAFINHVNDLIEDEVLTEEYGRPLAVEAQFIIDLINDFGVNGRDIQQPGIQVPDDFFLSESYPNPFNATTVFEYGLPEKSRVTIRVFDIRGNQIQELVNSEMNAGHHSLAWNAGSAPVGMYLLEMRSSNYSKVRSVVLIK